MTRFLLTVGGCKPPLHSLCLNHRDRQCCGGNRISHHLNAEF